MSLLGNVAWLVCGGLVSALSWCVAGLIFCASVIGIPVGIQCFKFAQLSLAPFGKEVAYSGGAISFLVNVIWLLVSGIPLALLHLALGVLLSVTVVGIPFGLQCFKFTKLSLAPFGAYVAA